MGETVWYGWAVGWEGLQGGRGSRVGEAVGQGEGVQQGQAVGWEGQ